MAFAKFNLCNPCCTDTSICHPYTVANVINPANGAPTPTKVDLWAGLSSIGGGGACSVGTAMYPSGGSLLGLVPIPSDIVPCPIPQDDLFYLNHSIGIFIQNYQNGTLIDLNTKLKQTSSNSRQRFDIPRYTGYDPQYCSESASIYDCSCIEVANNHSSAWGSVGYQVYPGDYFRGCSSGQYDNGIYNINPGPYVKCSQNYDICSSDICNGTGIDKHKAINLPYCLTKTTASIYDISYLSASKGTPYIYSIYNSDGFGPCSGYGTNVSIQLNGSVWYCHSATGLVYEYFSKANILSSGCNNGYYVPGANTTHIVMGWSEIFDSVRVANYCEFETKHVLFDCQDLSVNLCGETSFSPTVLSNKSGFQVAGVSCVVNNNCPPCQAWSSQYPGSTFAKVPTSCNVSLSYPFSDNQIQYQGSLTLDNKFRNTWVPNPFIVPCNSSVLSFPNYNTDSKAISITYQAYELSRCCIVGVGCNYTASCYQNEWNYGLISATCVDMSTSCTVPSVSFNGGFRYYPSSNLNNCLECCNSDGSPNGLLDCAGGGSCLNGGLNCSRAASPSRLDKGFWKTKSCCELYATFLNFGGTNWSNYCNSVSRPECIYDGSPLTILTPTSGSLVSDPCNDILSYSLYDFNGNLIYTVST